MPLDRSAQSSSSQHTAASLVSCFDSELCSSSAFDIPSAPNVLAPFKTMDKKILTVHLYSHNIFPKDDTFLIVSEKLFRVFIKQIISKRLHLGKVFMNLYIQTCQ